MIGVMIPNVFTDATGANTSGSSFDTTPPTIIMPPDINISTTNSTGWVQNLSPRATDDDDSLLSQTFVKT